MTVLGRFAEPVYALLRIVSGLMLACHGADLLFGTFTHHKVTVPLMVVGGAIQLVAGLMIALGLFAAPAAFVASGEMAVAYFMSHASASFWPILNKGELAVLYCFVFLYISAHGSGVFSLDDAMRRR